MQCLVSDVQTERLLSRLFYEFNGLFIQYIGRVPAELFSRPLTFSTGSKDVPCPFMLTQ